MSLNLSRVTRAHPTRINKECFSDKWTSREDSASPAAAWKKQKAAKLLGRSLDQLSHLPGTLAIIWAACRLCSVSRFPASVHCLTHTGCDLMLLLSLNLFCFCKKLVTHIPVSKPSHIPLPSKLDFNGIRRGLSWVSYLWWVPGASPCIWQAQRCWKMSQKEEVSQAW